MQTSQIQNYIFLDDYSTPHTLSTRYQAIPVPEYTTNLDKNMKQHFFKKLFTSLLRLFNICILIQVLVNENLVLKA